VTPGRETPSRGWFITIEGPEGAGKTTQAARLEAHLRDSGVPVVRTREPGGTALGERIREVLLDAASQRDQPIDPLADALLFSAARRQLVSEVIRPALSAATSVVCARFADSTLAYQGYGAGLPIDDLRALERVATGGLRPDLTILLDLPPEIGLGRKAPDDRTRVRAGLRPRLPSPGAGRLPRARGPRAGAVRGRGRGRRRGRGLGRGPPGGRPALGRHESRGHGPVNRNGPGRAYNGDRPGRRALGTRRVVDRRCGSGRARPRVER
jgi:dTMP kinase